MTDNRFDVVVIGGGSAGYAAARTLSAGGKRVAIVDGARELGGLCILRGCMPTKALLHAAELRKAIEDARDWGIESRGVDLNWSQLFQKKSQLIREFADYRRGQLEDGRFQLVRGFARFLDAHRMEVNLLEGGVERLTADYFVLATGSSVARPPIPGMAEAGFLTSDDLVSLERRPESVLVLGGGAVACETAQFLSRMGCRVTLVQRGKHLLSAMDSELAAELESAFRREGLRVLTGARMLRVGGGNGGRWLECETGPGVTERVEAEAIFHGMGRVPAVAGMQLDAAGVQVEAGRIVIDLEQRTTQKHIFAAGDCCGPEEVVHVAIRQGEIAAWNILNPGRERSMDYRLSMSIVFTEPQVAQVGLGEDRARAEERGVRSARYPFNDHGKSMILGCKEGLVKLVTDAGSGEILGGGCVGPQGGELIHEVTVAMAARMTAAQFAAVPHYHPTLAEIWTYPAEELSEPA